MTSPASAFSVQAALDARVQAEFSERDPDGYWHPSSLFGCLRQAIYASRGTAITDPRDDRSRRILRVGHVFHDYVQGAIEQYPSIVGAFREIKFLDEEHRLKGSGDQLVFLWVGPADAAPSLGSVPFAQLLEYVAAGLVRAELQEYKTINSRAFHYKDLPKVDHVGQTRTYLHILRHVGATTEDGSVIPPLDARGRITYLSKDDLLVEEHTVLLTPGSEREIVSRAVYLDLYDADGVALPPRLPDEVKKGVAQRAYLCNYCPFRTRCWEGDGPGVDLTGGTFSAARA